MPCCSVYMYVRRCNEGYSGSYCHVAATVSPELPLLISLSTLLPVAAVLVVVVTSVFIYRSLKARQNPSVHLDKYAVLSSISEYCQ